LIGIELYSQKLIYFFIFKKSLKIMPKFEIIGTDPNFHLLPQGTLGALAIRTKLQN